jgi:dihydrodipicolinate synthase/N-acetylneuraminate lyase
MRQYHIRPRGNWSTLLLPINSHNGIDYSRLSRDLDYLIEARPDGIYSNGTAGEFHNQTEEEFDRVQELMAEKCHWAGISFQIGVSHPSPLVSLERIKRSMSCKPSAFQVILPDWVVAGEEEQVHFLEVMAGAAGDIPLVLYNPPHAKSVLSPRDLQRISEAIPQLTGLKTGAGDASWYKEMRTYTSRLSVFVPGHFLATGVREGVASGAYSNVACLSPRGAQWWWQLIQTDLVAGLEIQERILTFMDRCIVPFKQAGYSNPALDKFLAAIGGWGETGTRLRWPYKWIDEKEVGPVREIAIELLPEFF